jgi:CheY-like chemotaxis protein
MSMAKIMVVDDDNDVRIVASRGLRQAGHEVIESESGLDCLEKLEDGMRPDLIFLDVMMPRNDGWAICRKIKTNDIFKDIFICMLTVRDTSEDIKKSLEVAGAEWHICKPELVETVDFFMTTKTSAFYNNFNSDFFTKNL